MDIIFNEVSKEFHIFNDSISYIFKILKNNQLGHLYFGKRLTHRSNYENLYYEDLVGCMTCPIQGDGTFSLDYIKQEFPTFGSTNFTEGCYEIFLDDSTYITNFEYLSHKIYKGKNKICDGKMPATFEKDNDVISLEIILFDKFINAEITLYYSIFKDKSVIARSAKVTNLGSRAISINRLLSFSVDLVGTNYEILELHGNWINERDVARTKLTRGKYSIQSLRGISSHHHNPFLALGEDKIFEQSGNCYGFSLVYSGNFLAEAEASEYNFTRVSMGINPFKFNTSLTSGTSFETPEVLMCFSDRGLNGISQNFHNLFKENLMRNLDNFRLPPIVINNWEATYHDFDEEKLLNLAKTASSVGIETFVLDDGWFKNRNDDTTSLGDWVVDEKKLPNGIDGLCKKINDLGMDFGIWIEPEMVSFKSDLYRSRPDWVVKTPNQNMSEGRNQHVLDFTNVEVVDYIFDAISKILGSCNVTFVKWDMNRSITEGFSEKLSDKGLFYHNYVLGVYDLFDRLTKEFPNILFEGCASGGGRFDPGMLYYAPQIWTSDNTDPIDRLRIQYGTSIVYPLRAISNHISAAPNHQTGRTTPISTRANVAYFGTFGYELYLKDDQDLSIVKEQINFYKKHRETILESDFYRLKGLLSEQQNDFAWQIVSKNKEKSLVGAYRILSKVNDTFSFIKLVGLEKDTEYSVSGFDRTFFGDELMNVGIPIKRIFNGANGNYKKLNDERESNGVFGIGDYSSQVFIIEKI